VVHRRRIGGRCRCIWLSHARVGSPVSMYWKASLSTALPRARGFTAHQPRSHQGADCFPRARGFTLRRTKVHQHLNPLENPSPVRFAPLSACPGRSPAKTHPEPSWGAFSIPTPRSECGRHIRRTGVVGERVTPPTGSVPSARATACQGHQENPRQGPPRNCRPPVPYENVDSVLMTGAF
jgi:hypothetical protein